MGVGVGVGAAVGALDGVGAGAVSVSVAADDGDGCVAVLGVPASTLGSGLPGRALDVLGALDGACDAEGTGDDDDSP